MMRHLILLAFLLCLPVRGEAWQVLGGGSGAGTNDATYTYNTTTNGEYAVYDNRLIGQSWTVGAGEGGVVKSITFYKNTSTGSSTLTCRIGTADGQINMSSSYVQGSVVAGTEAGEIVVQFSNGPTVSEGQNFAVACGVVAASPSIVLQYNLSSVYSGGIGYWTASGADYDLTGHEDAERDFYFKVTVEQ